MNPTKGGRKYRFFYHYNKHSDSMTVHFRNQCIPVGSIVCKTPCESKRNKTQPHLVMQGFAKEVRIENNTAYIL
jgi:hypothetical protein